MTSNRKITGVAHADPFDHLTWSGITAYLFRALQQTGRLDGAVAAEIPPWLDLIKKAINVDVDMLRWKTRYASDIRFAGALRRNGLKNIAKAGIQPDILLQIGAWYDFSGVANATVSYHDGNFAARLHSPWAKTNLPQELVDRKLALEKGIYRRLDLIFTMSKWLAGTFSEYYDVDPAKLKPVYAGINIPDTEQLPERTFQGREIVFVGIDFYRKGGREMLAAFRKVRQVIKDARLTIIGPSFNLDEPGVRVVGFVSKQTDSGIRQLLQEYDQADVFVLPTLYEPFGIVYCEAMSRGLPCIGSEVCAVPEIIADGETGYLAPAGDADALAERIIAILRDEALAQSMGQAGFTRYRDRFRWPVVAERMLDACDSLEPPS